MLIIGAFEAVFVGKCVVTSLHASTQQTEQTTISIETLKRSITILYRMIAIGIKYICFYRHARLSLCHELSTLFQAGLRHWSAGSALPVQPFS